MLLIKPFTMKRVGFLKICFVLILFFQLTACGSGESESSSQKCGTDAECAPDEFCENGICVPDDRPRTSESAAEENDTLSTDTLDSDGLPEYDGDKSLSEITDHVGEQSEKGKASAICGCLSYIYSNGTLYRYKATANGCKYKIVYSNCANNRVTSISPVYYSQKGDILDVRLKSGECFGFQCP